MTITAIKPFERGKNRVAVYLNDEFAFVLYKGELSKYGLSEGIILEDEVYRRILDETLIKRAKLRGMNLLQKMDRTESDIREKLSSGGYPQEAIDEAVDYLKSFHYIDDDRYASDYIRFKRGSMSRKEITRTLMGKGIPENIIENAFSDMEEDSGSSGETVEIELAKKLLCKKCSDFNNIEYADKMKLFAYLYRKGFSMDIIERAYKDLT